MVKVGDRVPLLKKKKFTESDFRELHPGGKLGQMLSKVNDTVYAQFGHINTDTMYDKIWTDIRHEDLETPIVGWVPQNEKYRFEWE